MKLIKLKNDHYIIVDDSEIKEGDFVYDSKDKVIRFVKRYLKDDWIKKITHSTQPLEYSPKIGKYWNKIQPISLSEVKELIGEVDIEKRAETLSIKQNGVEYWDWQNGFKVGYNQALEDNKEKKYTEEDLKKAIDMARDIKDNSAHDVFTVEDISGCTEVCTYDWRNRYKDEEIIKSLQPKTEWEVKIIDGKLKLK